MTSVLFVDTETTGLPRYDKPAHAYGQPYLVQLAAILTEISGPPENETVVEVRTVDKIVKPDGWTIPDEVARIHGISTERALAEGEPLRDVLAAFVWPHVLADIVCSYGIEFDMAIITGAHARAAVDLHRAPTWCAQRAATAACKIPPTDAMRFAGRSHFKTPNLQEAHRILLGEEFTGAHGALADVRALVRIVMHLRKLKREKAA